MTEPTFDRLVREAEEAPFEGWDFSWLDGRASEARPPWAYREEATRLLRSAVRALDIDTGGGEVLARLPLPKLMVATEGYGPNVGVASRRLGPLGIRLVEAASAPDNVDQSPVTSSTPSSTGSHLPFRDDLFDVVLNRHSSYWPSEVARVLMAGGVFLTQQRHLGGDDLRQVFGRSPSSRPAFTLAFALEQLAREGLEVVRAEEADTPMRFLDVGALVYYLRAVPWIVPDFDARADRQALFQIDERIGSEGGFALDGGHMLIQAVRPR